MSEPATEPQVAPDTTEPSQWVHVAVLGGDVQTLDYTAGMTVGQVLAAANVERQQGTVVTVNGTTANDDDVVEENSTVLVTSRVKNG